MKTQKSLTVVITTLCATLAVLFCFTGTVRAQSALDGFDNGETSASYTTISGNNHLYVGNGCGRETSYTLTVSISRQ